MRQLIDSAEDNVPDDIIKLNESIREQHRQLVTDIPRRLVFDRSFLDEPRFGDRRYLAMAPDLQPEKFAKLAEAKPEPTYPLERWLIQAHAYRNEEAAKASLLGRLFSGEAKAVQAGVVHDAKRFSIAQTKDGRTVEVGVAVRLSVATSSFSGKFELTLPNLAADAQLNGVDARIGITVLGYTGPLGDILPAPRKLDVETCADYIESFRKIQSVIFSEAGWPYVFPTALSYEEKVDGSSAKREAKE